MQLINLLENELLDLLLHNWRLLLNNLLRFSCLFLNQTTILTLQLSDQLLDLSFLLPLEALIRSQPLNTIDQLFS